MRDHLGEAPAAEAGFTLIELLVVILIIGILAAIAIPSFITQRSKAVDVNAKANARSAQTAEETYYTDNQHYTSDVSATTGLAAIEATLGAAGISLQAGVTSAQDGFAVAVNSTTKVGGAPLQYGLQRDNQGLVTRKCSTTLSVAAGVLSAGAGTGSGVGGCSATNSW